MPYIHRKGSFQWEVDIMPLRRAATWVNERPQCLEKDLREMAESFPAWFMAIGEKEFPAKCPVDDDYIVSTNGHFGCLRCGKIFYETNPNHTLIWTGLIPIQISGAEKVEKRVRDRIENDRPIEIPYFQRKGVLLLGVPIRVIYPQNWPREIPAVYYNQKFFQAMGKPDIRNMDGVTTHIFPNYSICLYHNSERHPDSIRDIIRDRVLPHAMAMVKIANGEKPGKWFNG